MNVRLSLIIPTLNEERCLPEALVRLRADIEDGADVLVVDGGSDDATQAILRRTGTPWIVGERGRARQMNAGAAATRGDVLLFLHADTALPAGWRTAVHRAIESGHVGGFFRVRLASHRRLLRAVGRMITLRSRITGIATGDQAIFVSRAAFETLGGYAPLPLFEDVDLMGRLRHLGPVARLRSTVVTSARRWERCGPARTIARMWLLRLLYGVGIGPEHLARLYRNAR